MRGKVTLVAGFFAVVFALPAGSRAQDAGAPPAKEGEIKSAPPAEERTVSTRSFNRFEFDVKTQKGFWAEAGFLYSRTDFERSEMTEIDVDLKTYEPFARFAYGGEMWEANLLLPGISFDGNIQNNVTDPSPALKRHVSDGGIGDIRLAGRFIPLRTALLDAGAGVDFSFPTGDEDTGGAGEVGALPFFTAGINLGVAEATGHVGWRFFTGNNNSRGTATDQLVYGFGIFLPIYDYVVFRNEFSGVELDRGDPKVVNYIAGLDIRVPVGRWDLLLRPTGLAGVTRRAPDFGVGFSIAFTSPSFRPAKGGSEYGDVIIE
jgi:hypothetical protein